MLLMLFSFELVFVSLFITRDFRRPNLNLGITTSSSMEPILESGFNEVKPVGSPLINQFSTK